MHISKGILRVFTFLILKIFAECLIDDENMMTYPDINFQLVEGIPLSMNQHLESVNSNPEHRLKIINQSRIDTVIDDKIEELKPYLQDDDVITMDTENNLTLEGKDETTIIEFIPKRKDKDKDGLREKDEPFKNNVNKYKRVRDKIKKALANESVSDRTQILVVKTLDGLIAKLIGSKCRWKTGVENDTKASNLRTTHVIRDMWNKQWKTLKNNYIKKFKPNSDSERLEVVEFLDKLQTFFSLITNDVDTLSEKYRIKCEFIDQPRFRKNQNFVYDSETDLNRRNCQQFAICSRELKNFMLDFYNFLNDTAVSVVRNYAEMYIRDTENNFEKQNIVASINGTGNIIEGKIVDIFIKHTRSFRLDESKIKEANLKALSKYVRGTINDVQNNVRKTLGQELKTSNEKLTTVIQADLRVNLKVDMENLEREILGRICLVFKFCNGKYRGRRSGYLIDINKENDIYVKVQLTLDEEVTKELPAKSLRRIIPGILQQNMHFNRNLNQKSFSYIAYNVTRTTPYVSN